MSLNCPFFVRLETSGKTTSRNIAKYSYYPEEQEVLTLAGAEFKITETWYKSGTWYARVKEVDSGKSWLSSHPLQN